MRTTAFKCAKDSLRYLNEEKSLGASLPDHIYGLLSGETFCFSIREASNIIMSCVIFRYTPSDEIRIEEHLGVYHRPLRQECMDMAAKLKNHINIMLEDSILAWSIPMAPDRAVVVYEINRMSQSGSGEHDLFDKYWDHLLKCYGLDNSDFEYIKSNYECELNAFREIVGNELIDSLAGSIKNLLENNSLTEQNGIHYIV